MDEQMIELIARELEPGAWAALGTGDTLAYKNRRTSSLRKAQKVIGVIAGKVAELTEALKPFAEAADWKESGYTFEVPDIAYCDVTLKDCRKARAALAPYPERRHD